MGACGRPGLGAGTHGRRSLRLCLHAGRAVIGVPAAAPAAGSRLGRPAPLNGSLAPDIGAPYQPLPARLMQWELGRAISSSLIAAC